MRDGFQENVLVHEALETRRAHSDGIHSCVQVGRLTVAKTVAAHRAGDVCGLIRDPDFSAWDNGSTAIHHSPGDRAESRLSISEASNQEQ
jgi:hypothetical protein